MVQKGNVWVPSCVWIVRDVFCEALHNVQKAKTILNPSVLKSTPAQMTTSAVGKNTCPISILSSTSMPQKPSM